MSIKSVLALTVLMSFDNYNLIQGEIIRNEDIPRINVTGINGKWYLVASTKMKDQHVCMSNIIEQQYEDNFTMNLTAVLNLGTEKNTDNDSHILYKAILNATMISDSSIIIAKGGNPTDRSTAQFLVIFDVVYDSFMAMYTAGTMPLITSGTDGSVFIFSRKKILPDGILEKVRNSNFYQQGVNPTNILLDVDSTACQ